MLRCQRCNQVVAVIGVGCICGEIVTVVEPGLRCTPGSRCTPELARLYINPDLHTHSETTAPPEMPSLLVEEGSTAVVSGNYLSSSWHPVPHSITPSTLQWRATLSST